MRSKRLLLFISYQQALARNWLSRLGHSCVACYTPIINNGRSPLNRVMRPNRSRCPYVIYDPSVKKTTLPIAATIMIILKTILQQIAGSVLTAATELNKELIVQPDGVQSCEKQRIFTSRIFVC